MPNNDDTRIALCDARGPLVDLLEKCSGENGPLWISALKKLLRKENPWIWKVWQTLVLGVAGDRSVLISYLYHSDHVAIRLASEQHLQVCIPETRKFKLEIVRLTLPDLGFKNLRELRNYSEDPHHTLCERAAERGLEICPDETAYQLALQCPGLAEPHIWRGRSSKDGIHVAIRQSAHFITLTPSWREGAPEPQIEIGAVGNPHFNFIGDDATFLFAGRKIKIKE